MAMDILELLTHADGRPFNETELARLNSSLVGLEKVLGLRYTHVSREKVTAEMAVGEQHLQPAGLVNGGVYSSISESLAGVAGMINAGGVVVGVNNNTDFIASVTAGVIEAEVTAVQTGRRTQVWQILMTHRGKLVARSTVRNIVL